MFKLTYMDIKYKINWQVDIEGEALQIEPVLFQLLFFIQQKGSLKKATEQTEVSYRYAWGLLNKWQQRLGKLVILEPGRGAHLSEIGEKLLNTNRQLLARFSPELDNFATETKRELHALAQHSDTSSLNIFASHGLAVSTLRQLINQQSDFNLDLHFHGSLECLRALDEGNCDIAGFHIPIGSLAKPLIPQYLDVLSSENHQLIYVIKRNQGLMFPAGNPNKISSLHTISNKNLRFVNRQNDSGTRLLFDQLLHDNALTARQINGFEHEEFTHMAVAALVTSGVADVGFGIAPVAEKFNLEFLPLVWEHYCLAVPNSIMNDPRVNQIIALLQSQQFAHSLENTSGYQTDLSGQKVSFESIFEH